MSIPRNILYIFGASTLFGFSFLAISGNAHAPSKSIISFTASQDHSSDYRSCRARVSGASGIQRGRASQALLTIGNPSCVEAQYGGTLRVEITLCDGREVYLSGIGIERNGFANGRRWSSSPPVTYELANADGTLSLPQPLGRGFGRRAISFPRQPVTGVVVNIPSRQTRGYPIYEQLCSISFDTGSGSDIP